MTKLTESDIEQMLIDQLTELSRRDQLSGCDNRNAYEEDMMHLERKRTPVGIIFADLNGLKSTNDSFGHAKGDQLIIRTAQLLQETYPDGHLYRIGGDEFILTFEDPDEDHFCQMMIDKKKIIDDNAITISIGWGWTHNSSGRERAQLAAEQMMYKNKTEYYKTHDRRKR